MMALGTRAVRPNGVNTPGRAGSSDALKAEFGLIWPLVMFAAGFLAYLVRTDTTFVCTAAIAALVAARSAYLLIAKSREIRFCWVAGTGLMLGYGLGTLNTAVGLARGGQTIAQHFSRAQNDLSLALAVAVWVSGLLFFVGAAVERGIKFDPKRLRQTDMAFVLIALLFVWAALASGSIGYMGASVSDDKHISTAGLLAGLLSPVLPALTILVKDRIAALRRGPLVWLLLLAEIVPLLPQGRRVVIYAVFMTVLACHLRGYRWRIPMLQKVAVLSLVLAGLYCANVLFYAMRHAAIQAGAASRMGAPDLDLTEMTSRAVDFIKNGRDAEFDQQLADNLRDRTFVLIYLAELISGAQTHEPLHGEDLALCFKIAIPSALYPNKDAVLAIGMEENLANPRFGLTIGVDEANSMLTTGVSDWGVLGCFLYPVLICLTVSFAARVLLSRSSEVVRCLVVFTFVFILFQTEMTVTDMFVQCRNLILVVLGWVPINYALRYLTQIGRRKPVRTQSKTMGQPARIQAQLGGGGRPVY